ncbi:hypothetical protein AAON49_07675 [Pseudotenacibaculum sp. MALMAid0570]|uniref:hypothetical protein n=1 Tax=Pseudotenacibaculum sp. MALMAid0570 TaxID=3143938 RepID=UPI0032DFA2F1
MKKIIPFLFISVLVISCFSVETKNPKKAFEYWAGFSPGDSIQILNGQYYQSPHFTLEYEAFLKIKPTIYWWKALVNQKKLVRDTSEWNRFTNNDIPKWFSLNKEYYMYKPKDVHNRSRFFIHKETRIVLIYDTIGM